LGLAAFIFTLKLPNLEEAPR